MRFKIYFAVLSTFSISAKAQTLENKITTSACQYIDSLPIAKLSTSKDKKTAIAFIFAKAVAANQQAINNDKRFAGLKSYEQGKKLGQLMSKSIIPLMDKCPKFKTLL